MSFLRNLGRDLVDKRLWPVALLLVGGIVALALVATKESSGGTTTAASAASAPAVPGAVTPAVLTPGEISVDSSTPKGLVSRGGRVRDPFKQQHLPKVGVTGSTGPSGSTGTTGAAGSGAGATGSTGTTGTTDSGSAIGTTGSTGTTGATSEYTTFRVALKFAEAGKKGTIYHDIARLTPLPNANNPFFVFLGVLTDEKTAVFLISSDVVANGDGHCRPSKDLCETIELKPGETEFFDVTSADGKTTHQYEIDLMKVVKDTTTDAARATSAKARESKSGRAAVRRAHDNGELPTDGYHYSKKSGLLFRDPASAATAQAGSGAVVKSAVSTVHLAPAAAASAALTAGTVTLPSAP